MNGNGTKVLLWVLIIIIVIGGIFWWAYNSDTPTVVMPIGDTDGVQQPGAPQVSTRAAAFMSQSTAVLNGEVNPNGVQTSYWYEYGTTNSLGSSLRAQLIGGGYVTYSAPASIAGLSPNTTYYYRLVAQNQYGRVNGEISTFQTTTTPPPASPFLPPIAQTVSATNITQTSATLTGTTNPNRSNTITWFEYGVTPALGATTAISSAGSGSTTFSASASVSALLPNTTYYYRFNAQNTYGTVNGNILSFTTSPTTTPPAPQGNAPGAITDSATNVTDSRATLNGQVNPNSSETTYYFEYGKSTVFGLFNLDQRTNATVLGSGTQSSRVSANLTGLDADTTYYYRMVAVNQYGTTRGAIFSLRTQD